MILPAYTERNAWLYPNKTAIVFEDRRCTFSELKDRAYRLANGLLRLGLNANDRVAILAENCFEYPEMYYAIPKADGIVAPLNYRLIASELSYLINYVGAKVLILQSQFAAMITSRRPELKTVEHYVCLGDCPQGMISYDALLADSPASNPGIERSMEDLYCLLFTGGTTGRPKGAMLTHRNLYSCALHWIVEAGAKRGDVALVVTPLFHTAANWPMWVHFVLGNSLVIMRRFDIPTLLATVEKEKVSQPTWMSSIIVDILNHPDVIAGKRDLSSVRLIFSGGAPLAAPVVKQLVEKFGCEVAGGGGQTEAGAFSVIRPHEHLDSPPEKMGSAGIPSFTMELKIVDENDKELPQRQVGELVVRGDGLMKGYWDMPEETAESMRGGWQHTGDLCMLDEEGYLYYVDRLKDMIKSGGENVYSKEVEDTLYAHPAILEAAVIGVPDEKWGEAVKALVVLKKEQQATAEEVIAHCKRNLAGFKCPKSVDFQDSLPKTPMGKIDKRGLREKYWAGYKRGSF
jgi:long-chain acyl-CoA synthetase